MPNSKFDSSRHIRAANQNLVSELGGVPYAFGLTYLSKLTQGNIGGDYKINK